MKATVKLALICFESVLGKTQQNREKAEQLVRTAAENGAELVCLPELYTTGYNLNLLGDCMGQMAEKLDGPTVSGLVTIAREKGIYVIAPLALWLAEADKQPHNSAVLIGPHGVEGVYSKCHLFEQERYYFEKGNHFPVFETALGRIGIMICFDAGFPEAARCLRLHGAEIVVCPAAWRAQDRRMWDLNMPSRALENSCYVAAINRYGREGDLYMAGEATVCGPDGEVLAQREEEKDAILYCEMSGTKLDAYLKDGGPYLPYRQEELYRKEGVL